MPFGSWLFQSRRQDTANDADVLPSLRRVVAGHDDSGTVIIESDTLLPSEDSGDLAPGIRSGAIWVTADSVPTNDNNSREDGATRKVPGLGLVEPNGTNLRYTDLAPGAITPMHRTNSLDYNILIQGSIALITDTGEERLFSTPGDVVVQKGNMHAWRNTGPGWARWVTVLIAANPAVTGGKLLEEAWIPNQR